RPPRRRRRPARRPWIRHTSPSWPSRTGSRSSGLPGRSPHRIEPMGVVEPIDLHHLGVERVIAVYLLDTPEGPALFDCGPASCVARLKAALHERGLELTDVRHLLLSH